MANWKYRLNLGSFYHSDIPITEMGKLVAKAIRKTFPKEWFDNRVENSEYRSDFDEITDFFGDIEDVEDFFGVMEILYDWADQEVKPFDMWPPNKMCWIETGKRSG